MRRSEYSGRVYVYGEDQNQRLFWQGNHPVCVNTNINTRISLPNSDKDCFENDVRQVGMFELQVKPGENYHDLADFLDSNNYPNNGSDSNNYSSSHRMW